MNNDYILDQLTNLIIELQLTNSFDEKKSILLKYQDLRDILCIIYDKNYKFNVTGDNIDKHYFSDKFILQDEKYILTIMKELKNKTIGGDFALDTCATLIDYYKKRRPIIARIFNKDLQCGIGTSTLEKVYNIHISSFKIPLANKYKKGICDFKKEEWYVSRKLDGIRCISILKEKEIKFYSRTGKEFFTLNNLKSELSIIRSYFNKDIVLDGEICIIDKNGNENFKDIMKYIHRKDFTIEILVYYIFDYWSLKNFKNKFDPFKYSEKLNFMKKFICDNIKIILLNQYIIKNRKDLIDIYKSIPEEWEGLMLRKNFPSLFKRSSNLLKLKKFNEAKYKVVRTSNNYKAINGVQTYCCTSIAVKHKGNIVHIGSGMTDKQRIQWEKSPEIIFGKTITVKYFEETKNKEGKSSLRFPVLKAVHCKKRTV